MNDFERDNAWQRKVRDAVLAPQLYGRRSFGGRYIFLDKGRFATLLQKRLAADTILQTKGNGVVAVEEKLVRWPGYKYTAFCLETHSCTVPGRESPGWMKYGEADYLLYGFVQEDNGIDCHLIDFPALRAWFEPREMEFDTFGPLETLNRTVGRKVPIARVHEAVKVHQFKLLPPTELEWRLAG